MPSDDPQSSPATPESDELTDLVEELVARILGATDPSAELETVRAEHPAIYSRVESIHRRLVREDMVEPAARSNLSRDQVDGYQLLRLLGRGGMGVVHLAQQIEPQRLVAIKLLRPELLDVESSRTRFRHEIAAVARLQHPGIVQVFEARDDAAIPYFVMEYVEGKTMGDVLKGLHGRDPAGLCAQDLLDGLKDEGSGTGTSRIDATQSWEQLGVRLGREICDALQHAHERGVLHRDVKPSNILLTRDGRARLVDFGLARLEGETRLTRSEAELGSLPFIPPENLRGSVLPSERRDVYGLGVTLYEFLSLHNPFLADDASETRRRILRAQAPALRHHDPTISWELETVIQKAMSPEPELRYASARTFGDDLARVARREPILAKRPGAILRTRRWLQRHPSLTGMIAVALVLLVAGSLAFAFRESQARRESERLTRREQESSYIAKIQWASMALERGGNLTEIRSLLESCPVRLRGFEWRHLVERLDASVEQIPIDEGRINSMSWSSDGKSLALLRKTGHIDILARSTPHDRVRLQIENLATDSLTWRPQQAQVACSLDDGSVLLQSVRVGAEAQVLLAPEPSRGSASALLFDRTGRILYTGHTSGQVLRIQIDPLRVDEILRCPGQNIFSLSLSGDEKTLAISTMAAGPRLPASTLVHRLDTGTTQKFVQPGSILVDSILDSDGDHLFAASSAGLELIDLRRHKRRFLRRGGSIFPTLTEDGTRIAYIEGRQTLIVQRIVRKQRQGETRLSLLPLARLQGHHRQVLSVVNEPGTHRFWTGGDGGNIRIWDPDRSSPIYRLSGSPHRITAMLDRDGRIVTGDSLGVVRVETSKGSQTLAQLSQSEITSLDLGEDDRLLVAHKGGTLGAIEGQTGEQIWSRTVDGLTCAVRVGEGYAVGTRKGQVILYPGPLDSPDPQWQAPRGSRTAVSALDHDADTGTLLVADDEGRLQAYDLGTRQLLWQITAHEGWIADAQIEPRGRYAVSLGQDKTAALWDMASGNLLHRLGGMDRAPLAMTFSSDGSRLVTSSGYSRALRIWDPLGGALLTRLPATGVIFATCFVGPTLAGAGMSDFALGGSGRMGEILCWRGRATEVPRPQTNRKSLDTLTLPPPRIR